MTGRTTTHDLCSSLVMWSPRKRTGTTGSDARSPPVATTTLEAVVIAGEELLLSVDAAWRLVRADPWRYQRLSNVVTPLVMSRTTTHDLCSSVVIWSTPEEDWDEQERRALAAGCDNNTGGGGDRGGSSGGGHGHGGSSRRPGGGGHWGGGSSRDGGNHRRNGGGHGGGGHGRWGVGSGKGRRGHEGHIHSPSGAHHSSAFGINASSPSDYGDRIPDVTVVRGKMQVVAFLVEVASEAELLRRLTIADYRPKPVSSNVDHTRSATIELPPRLPRQITYLR